MTILTFVFTLSRPNDPKFLPFSKVRLKHLLIYVNYNETMKQ